MNHMSPAPTEIGLPSLNDQQIESLAEECEDEITKFILGKIPKKSIAEISVSCILEFDEELDVDVQIDLEQSYDTRPQLKFTIGVQEDDKVMRVLGKIGKGDVY